MRTPGLRVAIIVAVAVLSVVLKGWLGRQHEQGKSERALAQLLTAARLDRAALDGLLNYMENTDISDLVHTPGLLTGWSEGEHNWLLQSALRERSLPGLQLAAGQGLVRAQTTPVLHAMLTDVMGWCASRSLRFRLRDFLIGRSGGVSWIEILLQDEPQRSDAEGSSGSHGSSSTPEHEVVQELMNRIPTLGRRAATMLHEILRLQLKGFASEAEQRGEDGRALLSEQVAVAMQDELSIELCTPFLKALIVGGGKRADLDASHIGAVLAAMEGAMPLLTLFLDAEYRLDHQGSASRFDRCLSCPACCLDDGVAPSAGAAMPFSLAHAAAAAGHPHLLDWLEVYQPKSSRLQPAGTQPTARQMLFAGSSSPLTQPDVLEDAHRSSSVDAAAPEASEAAGELPTDGWDVGWEGVREVEVDGGGDGEVNSVAVGEGEAEGEAAARCEIHSVSGAEVVANPQAFFDRFVRGAQPVLVRGLLDADRALSKARATLSREALLARLGDTTWEIGEIPYQGRYKETAPPPMRLEDYVREHLDACENVSRTEVCSVSYVFAERFWRGRKQAHVKAEGLVATPSWAATRVKPSKGSQFFLGGRFSGAPMHYHQAAYNMLVYGRKRWFLAPPAHAVFSMLPAHQWVTHRLPRLRERANESRLYQCDQAAGDLLVLPDLWGHLTYNLAVSIGIAQEFAW